MIACDNVDCKIEWFHWSCVNISKYPANNEKWYCPECREISAKHGIEAGMIDGENRSGQKIQMNDQFLVASGQSPDAKHDNEMLLFDEEASEEEEEDDIQFLGFTAGSQNQIQVMQSTQDSGFIPSQPLPAPSRKRSHSEGMDVDFGHSPRKLFRASCGNREGVEVSREVQQYQALNSDSIASQDIEEDAFWAYGW